MTTDAKHESKECIALQDTAKGLLVRFSDGLERWIPKSVIDDDSEVYRPGDTGTLITASWFAEKSELPD